MIKNIYEKQFSAMNILVESWKVFRGNFQLILAITLIVYIPVDIILSFVPVEESFESFRLYWRAIQILEGLIGVIATMAIAYAVKNAIDGKSVRVQEAFAKALSRWTAAVGTNILAGIFLMGLTLLLIIPGIIYYVYWSFITFAVVLSNTSGKNTLNYSEKIVKGRWWTVVIYSFLFGFLGLAVGMTGAIVYWFLPENVFTNYATDLLIDIIASFFTVVTTIFFINFDATKKVEEKIVS